MHNKMDEVSIKISELKPDIAIFCETWLSEDIPNSAVDMSGYTTFRNDRNKHGGGIIVYFSKDCQRNCVLLSTK